MDIRVYTIGERYYGTAVFTDPQNSNAALDPTKVYFSYRKPSGKVTQLEYGVNAAVVKNSTGNYEVEVDLNEVGDWHVAWWATGTGQAAREDEITVEKRRTYV